MDSAILNILYLFRGLCYFGAESETEAFGFRELYAVASFGLLGILLTTRLISRNFSRRDVARDIWAYAFVLWCVVAYLTYYEDSTARALAKFLLPFVTFVVLCGRFRSRRQARMLLMVALIGFFPPVVASAWLISSGQALYEVNYFTGLGRYRGVFLNPHDLGHNMTLLLMMVVIYFWLFLKGRPIREYLASWSLITPMSVLALYCLYQSYVRTAFVGLLVFAVVMAIMLGRRAFLVLAILGVLAGGVAWASILTIFYDVVEVVQDERDIDRIGSSRPVIWAHNLKIFAQVPFDRQIGGVGIADQSAIDIAEAGEASVWNSHNDYLELMMETGVVGLILFLLFQVNILRWLLNLESNARVVFISLFMATAAMNFVSNSYVSRTGLGQMMYMVLALASLWERSKDDTQGSVKP